MTKMKLMIMQNNLKIIKRRRNCIVKLYELFRHPLSSKLASIQALNNDLI